MLQLSSEVTIIGLADDFGVDIVAQDLRKIETLAKGS